MDATCYGGGDIFGAVFGTFVATLVLLAIGWWIYLRYLLRKKETILETEDPEHTKAEYAFDNPAFRNDANKTQNPMDPNWTNKTNSMDKRKTADDSCVKTPAPRLVSLRGSDFTGLGVEIVGGLKEGIFVKKVMPQGPAAGYVNTGDRITSITIDFRNIVLEDAMTILSYASPYNVQLEVMDVKGNNVASATQSPQPGHTPLTHPLYRSSSLSDKNTIERNSRKQLFPNEDSNHSTLKMENNPQNIPVLPTVHKENEKESKKNSFSKMKGLIEEKFQTKHVDHHKQEVERKPSNSEEGKKGLKFGIRVFPPAVNEKIFGKSPTKIQADNENNANMEKMEAKEMKETKEMKEMKETKDTKENTPSPPVAKKRTKDTKSPAPDVVDSMNIIEPFQRQNSINSSGIKRDSAGIPLEVPSHMMQAAMSARDNRKTSTTKDDRKGKGKAPKPPVDFDPDVSTETIETHLSMNDSMMNQSKMMNGTLDALPESDMKDMPMEKMNFSDHFAEEVLNETIDSITGIEKFDEDGPSNSSTPKSERKKSSLTESQIMAQEDDDHELMYAGKQIELNSSDITVHQASPVNNEDDMPEDVGRKAASLGDLSQFEVQKMNLMSSNNNTLERAQSLEMTDSATSAQIVAKKRKAVDIQVMEIKEPKLMNGAVDGRLKAAYEWGNLEDAFNSGELMNSSSENMESSSEEIQELRMNHEEAKEKALEIVNSVIETINNAKNVEDIVPLKKTVDFKIEIDDEEQDLTLTCAAFLEHERDYKHRENITLTPINLNFSVETNKPDHVKMENYDTNIPDDMKVSRYPFGSIELERPKSDVLKKILGAKEELEIKNDKESNKITIENHIYTDIVEPISLTLINNDNENENELTESSQASPVFTSNNQGISSINISSVDIDLNNMKNNIEKQMESPVFTLPNSKFSIDNIITISTESSQPSSIIMIDDEKLDFSLQTLDDTSDSMEMSVEPTKMSNFVTEITVKSNDAPTTTITTTTTPVPINLMNGNVDENCAEEQDEKMENGVENEMEGSSTESTEGTTTLTTITPEEDKKINDIPYIPRNTEIKFTTATYESSLPPKTLTNEKRVSQIEQIRSNFERSNSSEIPVLVRRSSIPTSINSKSPSRIPVFNSSKINNNNNNNSSDSQKSSPPSKRNSLTNNNNNTINSKMSVTLTSIKNQSRHPSGKLN